MIPHRLIWTSLSEEREQPKVRAVTILGFWCALAMILAFIFGCWLASSTVWT